MNATKPKAQPHGAPPTATAAAVPRKPRSMNRRDEFAFLNFDSLPGSVGVSAPVFAAVLGVSIPTLYGWVKSEILPAPRKIATTSRWLVSQVREAQGIAAGAQHE